jgi:60 kDa SS-A/Ro ribonucleoprotein
MEVIPVGHAYDVLKDFALTEERNRDGYPCFHRDWKEEYLQMLVTNTVSQVFYASEDSMLDDAISMHRFAADEDPEFMARALVYARNEGFMRLQPIVGLAVLSLASPKLFTKIFGKVVRILPDLVEFTLVLESLGRGQGGRTIKRAAAEKLASIDEYAVLKYAGEGRGYSLRDLLRVYHPKARDEKSDLLFRYIADNLDWNEVPDDTLPKIRAFEKLKGLDASDEADAATEAVSLIKEGKLPYNVVTGAVTRMPKELWAALMPDMPLFALVRHLSTLERCGVIAENEPDSRIASRLTDPEAIHRAKILPFRFSQAWQQVSSGWLRKSLERAVDLSVDSLPDIKGRTVVLLDISGSMDGRFLMAGSVLALSIQRKSGKGNLIVFDTEATEIEIAKCESILSVASKIGAFGGTDTGCGIRLMTEQKIFADNIVIVTDEQQNAGSPFYTELCHYRNKVYHDAKAFVVDVAPYGNAMVPTDDEKTFYCFGWSDQVVSFIARISSGYADLVQQVSAINLAQEK